MGLTISYSGTFKKNASLNAMINEAISIAEANHWEHFVFDTEFPEDPGPEPTNDDDRYGIVLHPPDCESVHLWFNSHRQLGFYSDLRECEISSWVGDEHGNGEWVPEPLPDNYQPGWIAFTKTGFASADIHIRIVEILRRISEKYFETFQVHDDSEFWETNDEEQLRKHFA